MIFEQLYKTELTIALNNNSTASGSPFSATNRQQAINDAQDEFADLTECLVRQSTVACSSNTREYNILSTAVLQNSSDFTRLAPQGLEYRLASSGGSSGSTRSVSGDDFPQRSLEWLYRYDPGWRVSTVTVQFPTGWYVRPDGGNLYLGLIDPPRIGSSEVGSILVPYIAKPAAMTSSSAEPFTVNSSARVDLRAYHRALPHYAAYKLLPLVGDTDGAASQLQQFLGYVTRYLQAQRPRGGQHVMLARSYLREASARSARDTDRTWARDSKWSWY